MFLVAILAGAWGCTDRPVEGRRRIVLLTLDTLRYDSFAGSERHVSSMPRMLARAERCTRFERFFAATSSTQPTHASLFTGLGPWQHGVTRNGQTLPEGAQTVAELLSQAGFETGAVVASLPVSARFGFGQGFQSFAEPFDREFLGGDAWEGHEQARGRFFTTADVVTRRALDLLDGWQGPRQFLWLHYFDPHTPYGVSAGAVGVPEDIQRLLNSDLPADDVVQQALARARDRYESDVAFLDLWLEALFQRLESEREDYFIPFSLMFLESAEHQFENVKALIDRHGGPENARAIGGQYGR